MKSIRKIACLFLFALLSVAAMAQNGPNKTEMADVMRSNGKIYVVIAVMLTILLGLILYIIRLDRRIRKMEKQP